MDLHPLQHPGKVDVVQIVGPSLRGQGGEPSRPGEAGGQVAGGRPQPADRGASLNRHHRDQEDHGETGQEDQNSSPCLLLQRPEDGQ